MSVIELCSLVNCEINNNWLDLSKFELSKKMRYNDKYDLTRENFYKLKEINEHNAILSSLGKDYRNKQILRLSYNLPNVNSINFSRNYIKSIPLNIINRDLKELNISHNLITNIDNIQQNLPELEVLKCNDNNISKLSNLPNTLKKLKINNNNIKQIPENIIECTQLNYINYEGNSNIYVSENVLNFIENIFERIRIENERIEQERLAQQAQQANKELKTVINNSQNVHETNIRKEVANAINILIKDICLISEKDALEDFAKNSSKNDSDFIKNLCEINSVCSITGITFSKLFKYFWNRVSQSKDKEDIIKTFIKDDIPEMHIVCFIGRISRVINCLSGYFEDIVISIPINEQIQMKYNLVSKQYETYKNNPFLYNVFCYYKLKDLLEELKLDKNKINEWIYPFIEELEDIDKSEIDKNMNKLPKNILDRYNIDFTKE